MKLTDISLRRPVTVVMLFVSLSAIGIISSRLLPLEYFPEIQFPGAFMRIPYQGSSPEEVERLITRPIEESLSTMSGIERIRSTTTQGQVDIGVFFGWDEDASVKGMQVMDKVDSVRHLLPEDLERIFVFRGSTSDQPIMVLRLSSDTVDLEHAYDLLNRHLKRRLERLEGVSQVRLEGSEPWEIRIQLIADRVAAHNIDINALTAQLQSANFSVTAGRITDGGQRLNVHPIGEFRSLQDIEDLIIRGDLRLKDIANISYQTRERNYGRHLDQRYAVGIAVMKETGANMVDVGDRVVEEIAKIQQLPQMRGITIFFLDNQSDGVRRSLSDLMQAGFVGALLSLVVLFLFLRQFATTLMVTLAVPFSLTIALAAMFFFGISLNILSMMGLMLAIGMLVDNAVVVTENIFRRRQMDPGNPRQAALIGTREVATAVTAGTLTSIIVFVPIIFGEKIDITVFLEHVAITIVVSLLASLFISLTIIPMIASRIQVPVEKRGGAMEKLKRRYRDYLVWALDRRWRISFAALFMLVLGFGIMGSPAVKKEMFPQDTQRRLFMPYHLEGTFTLERVEQAVFDIERYLYGNAEEFEIREVYSYFEAGRAESTILLTEEGSKTVLEIQDLIRENLPDIVIGKPSFDFNQSGNSDGVGLQIMGESSEVLFELANEVERTLHAVEGLTDVRKDVQGADREIQIRVNRDRARQNGLSAQTVASAVAVAIRGQNLRQFRGENGEITVKLEYRDDDRESLTDLENLPLFTPEGTRVPLAAVADLSIRRGPARITRLNRSTTVGITAGLEEGATMEEVKPRIEAMMNSMGLPAGYSWQFGRGFERNDQTQAIFGQNMLLSALLIFIVMAALFEAIAQPLGILLGILFSFIGVFLFFAITQTTFSFMAMIGMLILMGVVVNNGIVLVDHINNLRREGMPRHEAVIQGAIDRVRPILMTVTTTIVGMTPLAISATSLGGDGPPYYPMARAIIGGLAFSTLVTLIALPTFYEMLDDVGRWGKRIWRRARDGTSGQTALEMTD